jgi:hypothetical protein
VPPISTPAAVQTFSVTVLASAAKELAGAALANTEGGFSEPGSAKLTIKPSWLALVMPRSANVKLRDCDAPG